MSDLRQIKQISRRTVYENRWMKVHEDQVRFPSGADGIYGVADKPDCALIVPRHRNGTYQLVRQYRYTVGGRYWEFPQGGWEDQPNADPKTLALGELEEETGFQAKRIIKLGFLYSAYGFCNQGCHYYLATQLVEGQLRRDPEEEDMETAAFSIDEIDDMIATGDLRDAPSVAALGLLHRAGA